MEEEVREEEEMNRVGQLERGYSRSTGMRIPGQRHTAHCSTAPAGSQRLLPESQEPPKLPSWERPPRRPPPTLEHLPFWTV